MSDLDEFRRASDDFRARLYAGWEAALAVLVKPRIDKYGETVWRLDWLDKWQSVTPDLRGADPTAHVRTHEWCRRDAARSMAERLLGDLPDYRNTTFDYFHSYGQKRP